MNDSIKKIQNLEKMSIKIEHAEALSEFIKSNGRNWKSKLNEKFLDGSIARESNGDLLQQLRNRKPDILDISIQDVSNPDTKEIFSKIQSKINFLSINHNGSYLISHYQDVFGKGTFSPIDSTINEGVKLIPNKKVASELKNIIQRGFISGYNLHSMDSNEFFKMVHIQLLNTKFDILKDEIRFNTFKLEDDWIGEPFDKILPLMVDRIIRNKQDYDNPSEPEDIIKDVVKKVIDSTNDIIKEANEIYELENAVITDDMDLTRDVLEIEEQPFLKEIPFEGDINQYFLKNHLEFNKFVLAFGRNSTRVIEFIGKNLERNKGLHWYAKSITYILKENTLDKASLKEKYKKSKNSSKPTM